MAVEIGDFLWLAMAVFFIWLGIISFLFYRLSAHYRRLTKGTAIKDLKSALEKLLKDNEDKEKQIEQLLTRLKKLEKDGLFHLQKVGLIRFNPFAETGGDQSFCLALLDAEGSGLVISSLHTRENTRVYAKPVKENKEAGYALSEEEIRAIKEAKVIK